MELLLLLLLLPIGWLVLMPRRAKSRVHVIRFTSAGVLMGVAIAAWVGLQMFSGPQTAQSGVDYTAGDSELRAILLTPETAPRYSSAP